MDWKTTYQELDSASLLALLPILQERIDWGMQELRSAAKAIDADAEAVKETQESLDRLRLLQQGGDVTDAVGKLEKILQVQNNFKPDSERHFKGLSGYVSDLVARKQWIVITEAPRRGLLPDLDSFLPTKQAPVDPSLIS